MPLKAILVEDNETIRFNLIAALAELADVEVIAVADAQAAALAAPELYASQWDLVVVDLFLREGSGLGVLRGCADRQPHQKALVLTNFPTIDMRHKCGELGADGLYDKSTELDAFFERCRAIGSNTG